MNFPKEERNNTPRVFFTWSPHVVDNWPVVSFFGRAQFIQCLNEEERSALNLVPFKSILGISSLGKWTPSSGTCRKMDVPGFGNRAQIMHATWVMNTLVPPSILLCS